MHRKSAEDFPNNEEWYYYDWNEMKYKLTDKAPKEAIESYKEFYEEIDYEDSSR